MFILMRISQFVFQRRGDVNTCGVRPGSPSSPRAAAAQSPARTRPPTLATQSEIFLPFSELFLLLVVSISSEMLPTVCGAASCCVDSVCNSISAINTAHCCARLCAPVKVELLSKLNPTNDKCIVATEPEVLG